MAASQALINEVARIYDETRSCKQVAARIGVSTSTVERILDRAGIPRVGQKARTSQLPSALPIAIEHAYRVPLSIENGHALIGSDAHIWPGQSSTALRGFVKLAKELKPKAVVMNGDVLDFSQISRHPPIGWERRPSMIDEMEAAKEQLREIERACPKDAHKVWTLGNHDARFETRLATVAPEYARVHGVHLKDHFPDWTPAWACWINDDVVVKHRYRGGEHAPHNNTLRSGKSMIVGHQHSLKVTPFTDYNGTRFGVDGGCLAEADGQQFVDYTEDNPKNWRSGFVVLTFVDGRLMWPEVAHVIERDQFEFRGQIYKV